jgi:hypothetical protein
LLKMICRIQASFLTFCISSGRFLHCPHETAMSK